MNTKKCTIEPTPPPPEPSPCEIQRKRLLVAAGKTLCPEEVPPPPPPPPQCLGICIEKIKNLPVKQEKDGFIVCVVERQATGQARCAEILEQVIAKPDLPWPGCPPPPLAPPPPPIDPCEEQAKRARLEECKERMKRYLE